MQIYGNVINGKLEINRSKIDEYIKMLGNCKIILEIKKIRAKRTTNQNALYWIWLQEISNDTGYETEELHNTFRAMFLTDRSKKLPLVRSTTVLSTLEFMQYMEKIKLEAISLGINLSEPKQV